MGKLIDCPVLHVNADDVEAVVYASKLAVDYRSTFHEDIIVDVVGYRRLGHNEVDEPRFTQPAMYKHITDEPPVVDVYGEELERLGLLRKEASERLVSRLMLHLGAELAESKTYVPSADAYFQKEWAGYRQADHCYDHLNTGVDTAVLKETALASVTLPASFHVHPRLLRSHVEARRMALSSTGYRHTAARWLRCAHVRPGRRTGHFLTPSRCAVRPAQQRRLHSFPPRWLSRTRAVRQLQPERAWRAGIRVRLQPHIAAHAECVGGAVLRLRSNLSEYGACLAEMGWLVEGVKLREGGK